MRIGGGAVSIADVTDRVARDLGFVRPFWLNEIRAGRAFVQGDFVGASGGVFSHLQLINPAGSGITVIVHRIGVSVTVSGGVQVRVHNTALANLSGAGTNLLSGDTAGIGEVRNSQTAGVSGTSTATLRITSERPVPFPSDWFFELGAGEGILLVPTAVNIGLAATYEWIEF